MKTWRFKVKSNPVEISKKLESSLGAVKGFVFDMNQDNSDSVTFKVRKRILYAWYMVFQNWTVVNGKLIKSNAENKTNVEISFHQHFLITLIIMTQMFLGIGLLVGIISGISNNTSMYVLGGILIVLAIVIWIAIQKKFEKDILKYKSLITQILES